MELIYKFSATPAKILAIFFQKHDEWQNASKIYMECQTSRTAETSLKTKNN